MRKNLPLAKQIEGLAPSVALDGPNPEYPWPIQVPVVAPCDFNFPVWRELQDPLGRKFLNFLKELFRVADQFL